jgi:hypothetical protein
MTLLQVVEHDDIMAIFDQRQDRVAANIASAAGHQNFAARAHERDIP